MNDRLVEYLGHMKTAASDACAFVEGMSKEEFLADKRTQQAAIMSLVIIGEAATRLMDRYSGFIDRHPDVPAQYARHAESSGPRIFRDQHGRGMGYRKNGVAGPVGKARCDW